MSNNRQFDRDFVLYFHRDKETELIFYVGIGRPRRAYKMKGRGKRWQVYVSKHGLPKVEIYKTNLTMYEAQYLESYFIKACGRRKIDDEGILVNITSGGDATLGLNGCLNPNYGKKMKDDLRKKLSEVHKGKKVSDELRKIWSEQRKGNQYWKSRTAEGIAKISQANKRRIYTDEMKKKYSDASIRKRKVINIITEEIYNSIKEAADKNGYNVTTLSHQLNGKYTNRTNLRILEKKQPPP